MLIPGLIAGVCGAAQLLLTALALDAVFKKNAARAVLWGAVKLAVYGAGIPLLLLKFSGAVLPAGIGFGAGFLAAMLAYTLFTLLKKEG